MHWRAFVNRSYREHLPVLETARASVMQRLRMILEMIRFSHTVFALPFALLSAVMAWTLNAHADPPTSWRWREVIGIIACMVFCAQRGHGLQSSGRSTARRRESSYGDAAPARRAVERRQRRGLRGSVRGRLCRRDVAVFAEPMAAVSVAAGAGILAGLQLHEAFLRRWPIFGSARR